MNPNPPKKPRRSPKNGKVTAMNSVNAASIGRHDVKSHWHAKKLKVSVSLASVHTDVSRSGHETEE